MCTSCNQNTMSLIPELESMFRQNGRRIADELSSGINSYGGYQQEYETGQTKSVPKPSPGSGLSANSFESEGENGFCSIRRRGVCQDNHADGKINVVVACGRVGWY